MKLQPKPETPKPLITEGTRRTLTTEGKLAFKGAYESALVTGTTEQRILFNAQAAQIIREAAKLRRKDWVTTARWNSAADETGLLGELGFHRAMGATSGQVLALFLDGLQGDHGGDFTTQMGHVVDVKATRGQALRFKFNSRNKHANVAHIVAFAHVLDEGYDVEVRLLGWSWKSDVNRFTRNDGRSDVVRLETLRREGLVYPVPMLQTV